MSLSRNTMMHLPMMDTLRLHRGTSRIRGTHWRHVSHLTWGKLELNEADLREVLSYDNDMYVRRVEVEDPYRRNKFIGGFLLDPRTWAVIHRANAHIALPGYADLGKFSVIWPNAKVAEGVSLGSATEVRPDARIESGVEIADRSLVNKYARVRQSSKIGSMVFLGTGVQIGREAKISSGTHIARNVSIGDEVEFYQGRTRIEQAATLGSLGTYGSSVFIGHHVRIADRVTVGDEVKIAPYTVIEGPSIIGAGQVIGEFGADYPTAFVQSGTFLPSSMADNMPQREEF